MLWLKILKFGNVQIRHGYTEVVGFIMCNSMRSSSQKSQSNISEVNLFLLPSLGNEQIRQAGKCILFGPEIHAVLNNSKFDVKVKIYLPPSIQR